MVYWELCTNSLVRLAKGLRAFFGALLLREGEDDGTAAALDDDTDADGGGISDDDIMEEEVDDEWYDGEAEPEGNAEEDVGPPRFFLGVLLLPRSPLKTRFSSLFRLLPFLRFFFFRFFLSLFCSAFRSNLGKRESRLIVFVIKCRPLTLTRSVC